MYDGLKLKLIRHYHLRNHPLLDYEIKVKEKSGETYNYSVALYKNFTFTKFDSGTILLEGSIHTFKNNGRHNYDRFSFNEFIESLNSLKEVFKLNLHNCKIIHLEYGMNLYHNYHTQYILDGLIEHKTKPFQTRPIQNGHYRVVEHTHYRLKAYDKALQYLPNSGLNIFRFEVKFKCAYILQSKFNIYNLNDLLEIQKSIELSNHLLSLWNEVIYYDSTIRLDEINDLKTKLFLRECQISNIWKENSRSQRYKRKKRYKEIINSFSENTQEMVSKLILKNKEKAHNR